MSTQNDTQAPQWQKIIGLLDWAESILCNTQPMPHWPQDEFDVVMQKWRDQKHELFPLGQFTPQPTAPTAQPITARLADDLDLTAQPSAEPAATGTPDAGATPRTDAAEFFVATTAKQSPDEGGMFVTSNFARRLERELAEARGDAIMKGAACASLRAKLAVLDAEKSAQSMMVLVPVEEHDKWEETVDALRAQLTARDGVIAELRGTIKEAFFTIANVWGNSLVLPAARKTQIELALDMLRARLATERNQEAQP